MRSVSGARRELDVFIGEVGYRKKAMKAQGREEHFYKGGQAQTASANSMESNPPQLGV
jgi:hypothetical protein